MANFILNLLLVDDVSEGCASLLILVVGVRGGKSLLTESCRMLARALISVTLLLRFWGDRRSELTGDTELDTSSGGRIPALLSTLAVRDGVAETPS